MNLEIATNDNFNDLIQNGLTLVDFYADWCGPCKEISPILESMNSKIDSNTKIIKVNVDKSQELAIKYKVMSIPSLLLFKNGEQIDSKMGLQSENELLNWINNKK